MALSLLLRTRMPEPNDTDREHHAERRVVYETVSASSTKNSWVTIVIILVIAIALAAWLLTKIT